MSKKPVSRQRRLQIKWRAEGKCRICGKPAEPSKRKGANGFSPHCRSHQLIYREYQRKRNGTTRRNLGAASYQGEAS